jgi:hypothetical protein
MKTVVTSYLLGPFFRDLLGPFFRKIPAFRLHFSKSLPAAPKSKKEKNGMSPAK